MADETTITISGIDEVQRLLDTAAPRIVKHAFAKALAAAAVPIVKELQIRTPVEHGDLRRAITTKIAVSGDSEGGEAIVGFGRQSHKALWLEFGHRMVTHKPRKAQVGQVPARPFIRPAFDASANKSVEAFTQSMTESLQQDI